MAMVEPVADTTGLPQSAGFGLPKVEVLASEYEDTGAATFVIRDEDHTLGNSLRYMIMKNPAVSFCGYSIPHPSEFQINLRIQTDGTITAVDALNQGLDDLMSLCEHVATTFKSKLELKDFEIREGAQLDAV